MRPGSLLVAFVCVCSPFSLAQTPAVTSPADGADKVIVTTPALAKGSTATLQLYKVNAPPCDATTATLLALNPAGKFTVSSTPSTLTLADKVTAGDKLCAAEIVTTGGVAGEPSLSDVVTVKAAAASGAPTIGSAIAGSKSLGVTSQALEKGATAASYAAYSVDTGATCTVNASKQLATAAGTSTAATASSSTTLTLTEALVANTRICVVETFKDAGGNEVATEQSVVVTVTSAEANWGRVHAYFVGGVLITNDSSAFSSAHQFYDLTVEKSWALPGCYLHLVTNGKSSSKCAVPGEGVDVSGGKLEVQNTVRVIGTISKNTITNAVVTVTQAEAITFSNAGAGAPQLQLKAGQSLTIESGTLTDASYATIPGGIELDKNSTLAITTGNVNEGEAPLVAMAGKNKWLHLRPGNTSYFETRLTSIPVVSNGTNTTTNSSNTSGAGSGSVARGNNGASKQASPTPSNTGCSNGGGAGTNTTCSFITSPQTANVGVGVYLPFLLTRWDYNNTPNALFLAPIGKIGFNTITGATTQNVVLPGNGGTGTQSFEQLYNYYDYGVRIGHMGLTTSADVAPETYSFLDVSLGRFSNLESLICHTAGTTATTGSGCKSVYGSAYIFDSRKRLYRVDLEGLLKIPNTLFYVGFNANIGQKEFQAERLDPAFKAPDDLRFLFGTKFDIATLFQKLGIKQ